MRRLLAEAFFAGVLWRENEKMGNRFRILQNGGDVECTLGCLVEDFLQDTPESGQIEDMDERILNQQRLLSEIIELLYEAKIIDVDWINSKVKKENWAGILPATKSS